MASQRGIRSDTTPPIEKGKQDKALTYLRAHHNEVKSTLHNDVQYARRLRRKVDLLVMPFLMLCYSMNFLDKVLLNYAQVMGMSPALHLQGNDFTNASSAFWIAVLIAALPNIYLLQRLPVAKWLGLSLTLWGVCTACHAALRDYAGLLTVRIFCGIFESAVPSALILLSSQWYTRSEQAIRFSYWYCGMGFGQIFGGLFSWAFQHVDPNAPVTSGWRMMFLALGLFTVLLGMLIIFCIPDTPMQAWFFSKEERVNLIEHVKVNQTGIVTRQYQPGQLVEGLLDPQVWLMFFVVLLQGIGGGTITAYSATLLRSFGFSSQMSALLNMPSGAINIASTLFCGFMARWFGLRWIWCSVVSLIGVMGAALMSWISTNNQSGSLAGIYLANFIVGSLPVQFQWVITNTAGHSKRAFVAAMMNAAFAIGNIIGPQTFQANDAPRYQPAKIALVACWTASVGLILVLAAYYYFSNRQRGVSMARTESGDSLAEDKAFAGLTDRQNTDFRYAC